MSPNPPACQSCLLLRGGGWFLRWLGYTVTIILLGALAGGLAFLFLGKLFMPDWTLLELFLRGAKVGAILGGIWGSGLGVVLCFRDGHRRNQQQRSARNLAP